jgi:hypothetical protein
MLWGIVVVGIRMSRTCHAPDKIALKRIEGQRMVNEGIRQQLAEDMDKLNEARQQLSEWERTLQEREAVQRGLISIHILN